MADKSIRKEKKQPKKKPDKKEPVISTYEKPVYTEPELIRKVKKEK